MNIQVNQVMINNIYKDNLYVKLYNDSEIENLLYLKFYNNINNITVEFVYSVNKQVIRKIMLMEHVNKVIYENNGHKEEVNTNRKLIVKIKDKDESTLISDEAIIKFQQILDITQNLVVVQDIKILNEELLNIVERNGAEFVRVMDFGKKRFTIQQIKNLKEKINETSKIFYFGENNIERFMKLYEYLCSEISVDRLDVSYGNIIDIIYAKTTLVGYSEILKYILNEVGIENKVIIGKLSNEDIHYWNQVKIDGVWYNVDLALDAIKSKELDFREFKYCLKKDEEFYSDHITISSDIEICNENSNYYIVAKMEKQENFIVKILKKLGIANMLYRNKKSKALNSGVIN